MSWVAEIIIRQCSTGVWGSKLLERVKYCVVITGVSNVEFGGVALKFLGSPHLIQSDFVLGGLGKSMIMDRLSGGNFFDYGVRQSSINSFLSFLHFVYTHRSYSNCLVKAIFRSLKLFLS